VWVTALSYADQMNPRSVRQGLLVAIAAALAGCHTIYPFDRQDAGLADAAVADQAALDAAADVDVGAPPDAPREGPAVEGPVSDLPPGDQLVVDLPLPDLFQPDQQQPDQAILDTSPAPDACVPGVKPPASTVCVDGEGAATNGCTGICAPADDLDCDGLKGPTSAQDPWPLAHNGLLVADGFSTTYSTRWTANAGVTQDLSAGTIALPMTKALFLKPSCAAAFSDTDHLVEVRFSLATLHYSGWVFQVHSALDVLHHRLCRLAPGSGGLGATLLVEAESSASSSAKKSVTGTTLALGPGAAFILQSWGAKDTLSSAHNQHCRLLTPDGASVLLEVSVDHPLTKPGGVALGGDGRDFVVDHVRIYKH